MKEDINKQIKALYALYSSLVGPDRLIVKAGKLDALELMRSTDARERLLALQRLIMEDPTLDTLVEEADAPILLASLEEEGEAYLEELPEQLQDQAGHRLHRFSASARNALRIGSIFYMSALLYPEDHKPGQPDDLQVFIRRLRDEGEHYTLHPQD